MLVPAPGQVHRVLGGQLDVRVEIDTGLAGSSFGLYDVAEYDVDVYGSVNPDWNDITVYALDIVIDQGATRWGERFRAGTADILLDNTTGIFTPDSGVTSPWHLPFRPGRRVRIVCYPDPDNPLDEEYLFYGEIDATFDIFAEAGFDVTVNLPCTDFMAAWSDYNPPALVTPTGVEDTDERVVTALDRMGWDVALRDIQIGAHTLQSSFLAQSTLEECQTAADAEGSAFFCSKDGKATFKARDWLITDARSIEVQGYIGYEEVPTGEQSANILDVQTSWEIARVANQIQFARVGSTMQEVEDSASQALHGVRSYPRTDFQNNADSEVMFLAARFLDQWKDSRIRVDAVTISGNDDPLNQDLNRLLWDSQLGDLEAVRVKTGEGWFIEKLVKIFGIRHHIWGDDWETTFRLDDAFIQAGGSDLGIEITFEGGGEKSTREGGSEMALAVSMEGEGTASSKFGGSEMSIAIGFEGVGTIDRAELMALLAPEAWWGLNSGDETPDFAEDLSGNGHFLTHVGNFQLIQGEESGGPIPGTNPPFGTADGYLAYDGTNDYSTVANEADLELRQDMSIEMWVRPHDASGAIQQIISCMGVGSDMLYQIGWNPSTTDFIFYPHSSTNGISLGIGTPNVWQHVVITIDWNGTTDRTICNYHNGDLNGILGPYTYIPGVLTREVRIGRRGSTDNEHFDGEISELTIFDRVLTADEVRMLFESTYLAE